MAQYCRYCTYLCVNRGPYCEVKGKLLTESSCKRPNNCENYDFVDCEPEYQDAFMENIKGYRPRKRNQSVPDGQLRLEDMQKGE